MFPQMLAEDRRRAGFTLGQVAWRIGVPPAVYREFETGTRFPTFDTWDRMCTLYGWPQTFVRTPNRPPMGGHHAFLALALLVALPGSHPPFASPRLLLGHVLPGG